MIQNGAQISSPQQTPVIVHTIWHLMTCGGVLNPSCPGETDDGLKKSPSSEGRKRKMEGQRQTDQLVCKNIGGDNIGCM